MKKLLFILLLNLTYTVYAQAPIGWYVLGGVNQSSIKSDYLASDPSLGYNIGIIFPMGYHETYNFQLELLFTQKATNFKTVDNSYENISNSKYFSGSVDVGFYTNYYILTPDEDKLFIGPQAGLSISLGEGFIKRSGESEYLLPYFLPNNEIQELSKINATAGFGITAGYNRFKFELRYNLGLTNVLNLAELNDYDDTHTYQGPHLEGKLNSLSLNISYLIYKRIKRR